MTKAKVKTCFIIMPLTTPKSFISEYRDGEKHFHHVLEGLFIPAIEKADFNPIKPIAKGADLIHAGIIKHLIESDLVLCDMSTLNPNVFFEYGIRTALNKPICLIKDDKTDKSTIPFDIGIINFHTYDSSIELWNIKNEIEKLSEHLTNSDLGSKGQNDLWKYFGFKTEAKAPEQFTEQDKFDIILRQLNSLRKNSPSMEDESIYFDDGSGPFIIGTNNAFNRFMKFYSEAVLKGSNAASNQYFYIDFVKKVIKIKLYRMKDIVIPILLDMITSTYTGWEIELAYENPIVSPEK